MISRAFALLLISLPAVAQGFDRDTAPVLARLRFPPRVIRLDPNLRAEGILETLDRTIALPAIGKIVVDGAASVRLQIRGAAGAELWVGGSEDETLQRVETDGDVVWAPTTQGSTVIIAAGGASGAMEVTKLVVGHEESRPASGCLQDAACAPDDVSPEVDEASRAIALIRFVRGEGSYVCTGGLVNDTANSGTPYLLTARHCIATQEEADSIEAVWDLRAESCGRAEAPRNSPRTYGGRLLVASTETDVALLRLNRIPAGRVFLTVDTTPLDEGAMTYRLSHADGAMQSYSAGEVRHGGMGCDAAPRPRFVYTSHTAGAVAKGSSGAPLLLPGLRVAGQLLGMCGPSPNDSCAIYNDAVDGSMASSWPLLAPYLDPPPAPRRRATRH